MATMKLGKLQEVDIRKLWNHEQYDFSEWLSKAENLELLNEAIGLTLSEVEKEVYVGSYRCDLVGTDETTGDKVIIENQLEMSNHDHLGKIITYASGLDAKVVVWIVKEAREEHRSAIEWLNNNTPEKLSFFLIEIHAYQIGDSLCAPKFEVVEKPNGFIKNAKTQSGSGDYNKSQGERIEFWTRFNEVLVERGKPFNVRKPTSIVDWAAYKYPSDWVFGTVIDKEYYFMCIHPDGSFEIKRMVRNLLNMTEYDSYMDFFCIDDFASGDYSGVAGLIKDSYGNINLIKETEVYTVPDFERMGDVLSNVVTDVSFIGAELAPLLHDVRLSSDDIKIRAELDVLIPTIDQNAKYDKKTIMGMLKGMKTKKAVVKHVFENAGVMLYAFLRGEEARNDYMSGTLDINYIQISTELARFCVGEIGSGMKYNMERASVIREVQAVENSPLIFKDLLPLMGVEFVRYGMLTVMPFPFKYLREYKQMR